MPRATTDSMRPPCVGVRASVPCPQCGTPAPGKFCHHCGAGIGTESCSAMPPGGPRFVVAAWVLRAIGLGLAATLGVGLARPSSVARHPTAEPSASPQVRFDRLYRQIIAAAQAGDQTTVQRLAPMAFAAYRQLDSATVDTRYHLAMLHLHLGDLSRAEAQADTILASVPNHLFGYVIGAAVAAWRTDDHGRRVMHRGFLARYPEEIASGRAEYIEHAAMLREVYRASQADAPGH